MTQDTAARPATPASGTEAATRVADVLLLFLERPEHGVTAIARHLGLSKAVVHRILRSLESRGVVAYAESTRAYRLGPTAAALGARALAAMDVRGAALPELRVLARLTGETVTLSSLIGSSRVYLDQIPSTAEIKMTVELGRPFPLHAGASSRAILAFAPADLRAAVLAKALDPLTPVTITDPRRLRAALAETARSGIAWSCGERQPGAGSVAAPLFGADRQVSGAISVCGPVDRFDEATSRRYAPQVRAAARRISAALGWDGVVPSAERDGVVTSAEGQNPAADGGEPG